MLLVTAPGERTRRVSATLAHADRSIVEEMYVSTFIAHQRRDHQSKRTFGVDKDKTRCLRVKLHVRESINTKSQLQYSSSINTQTSNTACGKGEERVLPGRRQARPCRRSTRPTSCHAREAHRAAASLSEPKCSKKLQHHHQNHMLNNACKQPVSRHRHGRRTSVRGTPCI